MEPMNRMKTVTEARVQDFDFSGGIIIQHSSFSKRLRGRDTNA